MSTLKKRISFLLVLFAAYLPGNATRLAIALDKLPRITMGHGIIACLVTQAKQRLVVGHIRWARQLIVAPVLIVQSARSVEHVIVGESGEINDSFGKIIVAMNT